MVLDVSIGWALLAGVVSFLSPCVLPLVPPYLCFITGTSLDDLTESGRPAEERQRTMLAALLFVLGFSTVFVTLGARASAGGLLREQLSRTVDIGGWTFNPITALAGMFIILMGLHFLGVFRSAFLNREKRYQQEAIPAGLIGAYAVGLAFAFGWTPCIGPVLAHHPGCRRERAECRAGRRPACHLFGWAGRAVPARRRGRRNFPWLHGGFRKHLRRSRR